MEPLFSYFYECVIGMLKISGSDTAINQVEFINGQSCELTTTNKLPYIIRETFKELTAYFNRKLFYFSIPLEYNGTQFQKSVWSAIRDIKYGETISYLELSSEIGKVSAVRAVANACGKNKIPIIIPCHRVVGSNGRLGGFSGGLNRKINLLNIEKTAILFE